MKIKERKKVKAQIPTASMSDIAFLLIIFFMLTTVFRKEIGLRVELPRAYTTERLLKSRDLVNIYIDKQGRISLNDNIVTPDKVKAIMRVILLENPAIVTQLKVDKEVEYNHVWDVIEALREARAYRVVFATLPKW